MLENQLDYWRHDHDFFTANRRGERRTRYVLILTAITMVAEIIAGTLFGSMALLADGWHMGTHVAAFLITVFAYRYARKHADNPAYSFGTGKVGVLGGFASAVALATVALMMLIESIQRLFTPQEIHFNAAIGVAVLGLLINVVCALILKDEHHHHGHDHDHDHPHDHDHDHHHGHHDHNLYAAYMHVLADALTSLLAIAALLSGKFLGWQWLDPIMGIVGAVIIARWSVGLVRQFSPILLDGSMPARDREAIRRTIEADGENRITDFHAWRVSEHHFAAIITIVSQTPRPVDYYKGLLAGFHQLSHLTIEVNNYQDGYNRETAQESPQH
ncbi:MAG: CDF family Co(II)/Ni(II) efflux transporter DmeF [Porticoccaceae bacterium]